ncbi:MAG: hypothetical protein AAGM22_05755 [Acidobacteriota bacterium]
MGHRISVEVDGTRHQKEVESRRLPVHFLREDLASVYGKRALKVARDRRG